MGVEEDLAALRVGNALDRSTAGHSRPSSEFVSGTTCLDAINRDEPSMVLQRLLREDLSYGLRAITVEVPPHEPEHPTWTAGASLRDRVQRWIASVVGVVFKTVHHWTILTS